MGGPLTILHVVVNMNRGGAETFIMNLYRNIDRTKIQFDFLTFKPGVFDDEIKTMGGKVHRIPYVTEIGHNSFIKALNQFMKENATYKIVHSHLDKMSGFILQAAKRENIPVRISHSHNTESEGGIPSKLYKWYAGTKILQTATHFYACSDAAAKWLFKHKAPHANILNNGIETDKFIFSSKIRKKVKKELNIESDTVVLGHVGRFSKQKNHLFLLDVLSFLKNNNPNVMLVLIGEGPYRDKVDKRVKELSLDGHVKFLGVRSDIHELLQAFDLFMMPSFHEGLPLTLVEAQSAGLPCLISDHVTEEVDMGIGLAHFLSINKPEDWINKVMFLLKVEQEKREITMNESTFKAFNVAKTADHTASTYLTLGNEPI